MSDKILPGKITFIHHEKKRAVIEYEDNGKKKTIQADIGGKTSDPSAKAQKPKKHHRFLMGDHVKFQVKKTGVNGKILYATNIQYLYNTALELVLNAAEKENRFAGYVKVNDGDYFIKEIESYLFFPLKFGIFEIEPTASDSEKPVPFKLVNLSNPEKLAAMLIDPILQPGLEMVRDHFKKQTVTQAVVDRVTAYGIYVKLFDGKIDGKLLLDAELQKQVTEGLLAKGKTIAVRIKYLGTEKMVLEKAS